MGVCSWLKEAITSAEKAKEVTLKHLHWTFYFRSKLMHCSYDEDVFILAFFTHIITYFKSLLWHFSSSNQFYRLSLSAKGSKHHTFLFSRGTWFKILCESARIADQKGKKRFKPKTKIYIFACHQYGNDQKESNDFEKQKQEILQNFHVSEHIITTEF